MRFCPSKPGAAYFPVLLPTAVALLFTGFLAQALADPPARAEAPPRPRLLLSDSALAAARARCFTTALSLQSFIPAFDPALPLMAQWPASDRGRLALVYGRFHDSVHELMKAPPQEGFLAAVALCHLLEGTPGQPDAYTAYIAEQLQSHLTWSLNGLDAVLAMDWCYDALPAGLMQQQADTWAKTAMPLGAEVNPTVTGMLTPRLVDLAGALVFRHRPAGAGHQKRIQEILTAALQYPLVGFFQARGPVPTTPQAGLEQACDGWVYFELLRTGLAEDRWAAVTDSLGRSLDQTFWLLLNDPQGGDRSFPKDGGQIFSNSGVPVFRGLWPATPFVLADRTGSTSAAYFADRACGGIISELQTSPFQRLEGAILMADPHLSIDVDRFGVSIWLPNEMFSRSVRQDLFVQQHEPILGEAFFCLTPRQVSLLWPVLVYDNLPLVTLPEKGTFPLATAVGSGVVVMRTGFDRDATVILFDTGGPSLAADRWAHAGSFQIFQRDFLVTTGAVDLGQNLANPKLAKSAIGDPSVHSGIVHGDISTFSIDTVAASSIILTDGVAGKRLGGELWPIYGGQLIFQEPVAKWWMSADSQNRQTGHLLNIAATERVGYARADLSKAYGSEAVKSLTRELVFLAPDRLLVVDRIQPRLGITQAGWLMQLPARPLIGGKALADDHRIRGRSEAGIWRYSTAEGPLRYRQDQGQLALQTLWPADCTWRICGGPGALSELKQGRKTLIKYLGSNPEGFEFWCGTDDRLGGANAWYELFSMENLGAQFAGVPHWGRIQVHAPRPRHDKTDVDRSKSELEQPILYVNLLALGDRPVPRAECTQPDRNSLSITLSEEDGTQVRLLWNVKPDGCGGTVDWLDAEGQPITQTKLPK